jgi:hypothetical protein
MSVIKLNTFILSLVMLATITQSALLPKNTTISKKNFNFFYFQPLACSMLPFLSATNQNVVELSAFRMGAVILTAILQSVVLPKHHSSEKNLKKVLFFQPSSSSSISVALFTSKTFRRVSTSVWRWTEHSTQA